MVIRTAEKDDEKLVKDFCETHGLSFPFSSHILLHFNQDNKLDALIALESIPRITCLGSDTPKAAYDLFKEVIKVLVDNEETRVECHIQQSKMFKLRRMYEKLGFKFIEKTNRFILNIQNNASNDKA